VEVEIGQKNGKIMDGKIIALRKDQVFQLNVTGSDDRTGYILCRGQPGMAIATAGPTIRK
jgi:ribosomal protein S6E (S10)